MTKKKEKKIYSLFDETELKPVWTSEMSEKEMERLKVVPHVTVVVSGLIGLVLLFGAMIYLYMDSKKEYNDEINQLNEELVVSERNTELYCLIGEYALLKRTKVPHDTIVYEFIKQTGAWYPDILMAQWCLESTHGKSDLAISANNFYGMRIARSRMTLQEPDKEYKGYGVYRNWQWGVLDRVLWDLHIFDEMPTREEYLRQLGYIYAEDKDYISKITNGAKKWKQRDVDQVKKEENGQS